MSSQPLTRPASRYGDAPRSGAALGGRRPLIAVFAVFALAVIGFAGWAAVSRAQHDVTWDDLGVTAVSSRVATVTYQVNLAPGRGAVCTVRAVNAALTEVGRTDVTIASTPSGTVRLTTTLKTAELATGGGVKACVIR